MKDKINNVVLKTLGVKPGGGGRLLPGSIELHDLWQPEQKRSPAAATLSPFEKNLCDRARVSVEQLAQARNIHERSPRKRLGQVLLEMGLVNEEQLLMCLAEQYHLQFIRLTSEMVQRAALDTLERAFIEEHLIVPIALENGRLVLATSDPTNIFLQDEIRRRCGLSLVVRVATRSDIKATLEAFKDSTANVQMDDLIQTAGEDDIEAVADEKEEDIANLEKAAGDSPIIKFVNYVFLLAVKEKASDIHIEPGDKKLRVRLRIDGVLFEMLNPPHSMFAAIISRIKIMANLDIAERRVPQDGRIRVVIHGRNIDMRVSTLPTAYGEKVVIRILDSSKAASMTLKDLGFEPDTLEILNRQVSQPHGIVLVTGPTGSGKSTTLYGALRTMDIQRLNISTVEDPVEYQLDGINQVQVHDKIGMSFSAALRSLLRQDPDVIMVGEIRDGETARIAIQASLTGHLVLSTLHTNDAPSSITRLINIGVEPYLIAASVNACLAQRLVRRICAKCRQPHTPAPEHEAFLKSYGFTAENMFKGAGCEACRHTGYAGRVGLYELLTLDDTYRDLISKNPAVTELRRVCKERGMVSLRDDGFRKVQAGLTTVEEVMRVTESTL